MEVVNNFGRCPGCGVGWSSRDELLSDDAVSLTGYIATFESLLIGWYQFTHLQPDCESTFTVEVGKFIDLYDGDLYEERKTGLEECPRHCYEPENLEPCDVKCEFSFVRSIMQKLREIKPEPLEQT